MIRGLLLDLDGTVYWGTREVPGAGRFVRAMRRAGVRCLFVTNRANRTPEEVRDHLREYNIACETGDILTAAQATAASIKPGRVYCIGEKGMRRALIEAGFTLTQRAVDYVVVSYDRSFNYNKLATASTLIRNGARFIATNPDKALRTEQGVVPGTGALVAAVVAASGRKPLVIGKPGKRLLMMGLRRLAVPADEVVVVGDNLATDVKAGARAGLRTAFMLTGIGRREELTGSPVQPTWTLNGFEELTAIVDRENRRTA
jgi:HAD superfamily hydrolase (TIGR01457 family)